MKKNHVFFLLASLIIAGLLSSCGGGSGSGDGVTAILTKTPSDVVKAAIGNVQAKDASGVIKYYVRKDGQPFSEKDTEMFKGLVEWANKEYAKKQGLKEIQIVEEKIAEDGMTARVRYKLIFSDGSDSSDKANLKKVDGNWLIIIG
jgi:hypothetical protein